MALNDQRRIVQLGQDGLNLKNVNEALRQFSTWTNTLEGRNGLIQLRDGIQSLTSGAQAFANTSQSLPDASFGVFYTGTNGTDCWLASGAKLVGDNEWVALKTRAAMLKLSNSAGPLLYFNTGLTPGASFIPIAQSTTPVTPHWGIWQDTVGGGAGPTTVVWDTEIFADPAYFTLQSGGTEVAILVDGLYETTCTTPYTIDNGSGNIAHFILDTGGIENDGWFSDPSSVGTTLYGMFTLHTIWSFTAGEVVKLRKIIAAADSASSMGASRLLTIKLIQS